MKLTLFILCVFGTKFIAGYSVPGPILFPPQRPPLDSGFVVGGEDAKEGQAPFQCSLRVSGRHLCGCSIISSEWVLTAAHCVRDGLSVFVGSNQLSGNGTTYPAEKYIAHEKYNNPRFAFDIAVVKVSGKIAFNDNVKAIELSKDETPEGSKANLTGWGYLSIAGTTPDQLQVIELNVVQTDKCKELLGANVHDSHICTFNKQGEGACYGDSGGPLVVDNKVIGVVNFGRPCAQGYPDAYAKVSYLYDWVNKTIGSA